MDTIDRFLIHEDFCRLFERTVDGKDAQHRALLSCVMMKEKNHFTFMTSLVTRAASDASSRWLTKANPTGALAV